MSEPIEAASDSLKPSSRARVVAERAPVDARRLRLARCKVARLLFGNLVELVVRGVRHMGHMIAETSDTVALTGQASRRATTSRPRKAAPKGLNLNSRELAFAADDQRRAGRRIRSSWRRAAVPHSLLSP